MPLPQAPTNQLQAKKTSKADNELIIKAVLCVMIGLGVLLTPRFIESPGMQDIVARASAVGWFALVLGIGFALVVLRRRMAKR